MTTEIKAGQVWVPRGSLGVRVRVVDFGRDGRVAYAAVDNPKVRGLRSEARFRARYMPEVSP